MEVIYRKAEMKDIDALHALIEGYAKRGIMLPRSKDLLSRQVDDFYVAELPEGIVGCGSLCVLGADLVEIRSLGLLEAYKGRGIGRGLVHLLVEEARRRGLPKVMALTYEVAFFERVGFEVVPKDIFPEKVWKDCVHCQKQDCCDEIAVLKRLD